MSRKPLTILLLVSVFAIACGSALGSNNSKSAIDEAKSGSNNKITQLQKGGTYNNVADTLIEKDFESIPSMNVEAKINQNSSGGYRTATQVLAGTNIKVTITQSGYYQTATQTIRGKGIFADIKQAGKANTAEQLVRGIDHEAYIEQLGREGVAIQEINKGTSFDNLAQNSYNYASITQSKRSRKSQATQIIKGFANEATITQNTGSNNVALQDINGQQNIAETDQTGSNNTANTTIEGIDNEVYLTQNGNANQLDVSILDSQCGDNVANVVEALQLGSSNQAAITITGSQGNSVVLKQNKSAGGNNNAAINIEGSDNNSVTLIQKGLSNDGTINLLGCNTCANGNNSTQGNTVLLKQIGSNNKGTVDVSDSVASKVTLIQNGNGLNYNLAVSGAWMSTEVISQ